MALCVWGGGVLLFGSFLECPPPRLRVCFQAALRGQGLVVVVGLDLVVDVATKDKKIGMRAGEIELSKPCGIATFRTSGALRKIFLEKLATP